MSSSKPLTGGKVLFVLLAFFGVVVGVNATMTVLAVETLSGTEVASAYSASLAYKNDILAAREQEARHWAVTARTVRSADDVKLVLEAQNGQGQPVTGVTFSVRLQRPVDKRQDHAAALSETRQGTYAGELTGIAPGQWDLLIEAAAESGTLFQSKSRIVLN